jgi:hypothetical protein
MSTAERICFVTGFARSGTTVLTEAVALAIPAPTLTVGDLAHFMPSLQTLLDGIESGAETVDRGVDGRPVSADMPEEYCVYLARTSSRKLRYGRRARRDLQALADTVATRGAADVAVMKNPWDTTNEPRLLRDFPGSSVVIVRRSLAEIEASQRTAFQREAGSDRYMSSLLGNRFAQGVWRLSHSGRVQPAIVRFMSTWRLRLRAVQLSFQVSRLPAERTALLSYDEFKADPHAAARWAAHLLDADVLAAEFVARVAPFGAGHDVPHTRVSGWIDDFWARSWDSARRRHAAERAARARQPAA